MHKKLFEGNGQDSMATQVSKNTDHRVQMQGYMDAVNKKVYGTMLGSFIQIGIMIGALIYFLEKVK